MTKNYIEVEHEYVDHEAWHVRENWVAVRHPYWDMVHGDEKFPEKSEPNSGFYLQNSTLSVGTIDDINGLRKLLDAIEAEYVENAKKEEN